MDYNNRKPEFTKDFVLRTTLNHMIESINISIKKTIKRIREFEDNPEKTEEIKETLDSLTALNNMMKDIKINNRELIERYRDD